MFWFIVTLCLPFSSDSFVVKPLGTPASQKHHALRRQPRGIFLSERNDIRLNAHRRPLIAGNWKLNPATLSEAQTMLKLLASNFLNQGHGTDVEVAIFPPYPYLTTAIEELDGTGIKVGAQNVGTRTKGAFTGEVAVSMITSLGCDYIMLGHSERRVLFKESDELINEKLQLCLTDNTANVILCVGETEDEYESDLLESIVDTQVKKGLAGVSASQVAERVVIAYEPVWAIGTGKVATPEQAQTAHVAVRKSLSAMYGGDVADRVRVLYGGSVTPESIESLMAMPDVDGALVGGASLIPDSFTRIADGGKEKPQMGQSAILAQETKVRSNYKTVKWSPNSGGKEKPQMGQSNYQPQPQPQENKVRSNYKTVKWSPK